MGCSELKSEHSDDFKCDAVDLSYVETTSGAMLNGREGPAMLKGAGRKKSNVIHHRIFDQEHIAIAHNDDLQKLSGLQPVFNYFSIEGAICYVGFADVFGPMNDYESRIYLPVLHAPR